MSRKQLVREQLPCLKHLLAKSKEERYENGKVFSEYTTEGISQPAEHDVCSLDEAQYTHSLGALWLQHLSGEHK